MNTQIVLHFLSIKGLSTEFIRENKKNLLSVAVDLHGQVQETNKYTILDETSISFRDNGNSNILKWDIDTNEFQQIKASQPKIKIQIHVKEPHDDISESIGFSLLDLRDINKMKDPKWIKVYGFKNAELLMKCTYMEQYIPSSPSTLLPNTIGSEDLLRQSLSFDNPGLFTFQFSLDEYQDILELCQLFGHSSDQKYILRWQLFGQHFHSDEFGPSFLDMSPKPIQDIFQVQCPKDTIISKLIEQFPISLELLMIRPNHTIEENDLSNVLALASISFSVEDILRQAEATKSEVSVGMASVWFGLHPVDPSLTSPQLFAGSLQETVDSKPPEARIKVGFHLKTFKDESKSQPRTVSAAFRQDYYGNFNQNQLEIPSNVSEQMNAQSQTYPITSIINNNNNNKNNLYDTIRPIGATSQVNTDNDTLHHFRVSIDVKSVNQLKKPANIVVSYTYPHLGATSLVRTTPVWLQPQSEGRVENGCAVFDCCMTRRELLTVFSTYPLKISISNKTQAMSTTLLGEVVIDLSYVQSTDPVSYRCLLTSHTFKSLQEYNDHRDMMIALRTAGHVDKIPPVDPVLIRATDCLYDIEVSASQVGIANDAKLRVITIVEDLGKVGPEVGLNVRQGYKQQGAGVYHDQDDAGPAHLTANERLNPLYKSAEILDLKSVNKDTMTATEQARWDILKQDWETWQKQAEIKWRESMREKEMQLREKLESEASQKLVVQVADLKRAHEAAARLEIRLRESISKIDQQKTQLLRKEEQMTTTLAQKTAELQLLQKTIRDEAKVKIDAETRRADALDKHIQTLKAQVLQLNKRCQETEQDFEAHRKRQRETPETMLREDNSRLRAQLAECKAEADRERRIQSELKLEKEQIRSQLHRMAIALKREKERNSALARQDLEQLRLEFLAREERYVLDGDREELRNIRHELVSLRKAATQDSTTTIPTRQNDKPNFGTTTHAGSQENINPNPNPPSGASIASHIPHQHERTTLEQSFLSDSDSDLLHDLLHELPIPPSVKSTVVQLLHSGDGEGDAEYLACIEDLNTHMSRMLSTGLYTKDDPAVVALRSERLHYEQMLSSSRQ